MTSTYDIRIYYEDTDAGGIVYYANYLKFAERARTEALRALGFDQSNLAEKHDTLIVVSRVEADYKRPARLDDLLTVDTRLHELSKVRMTMHQTIHRKNEVLVKLVVKLACVDRAGRPKPWPAFVSEKFAQLLSEE